MFVYFFIFNTFIFFTECSFKNSDLLLWRQHNLWFIYRYFVSYGLFKEVELATLYIIYKSPIYLKEWSIYREVLTSQSNSQKLEELPLEDGKIWHDNKTLPPFCSKILKCFKIIPIFISSNDTKKLRKGGKGQGEKQKAHLNANINAPLSLKPIICHQGDIN